MIRQTSLSTLADILFPYTTLFRPQQHADKAVRTAAPGATIPEVTIPTGSAVTLKAASTGAVSYQWFRDGEVIDGALEAEYSDGEAGVYTVLAMNVGGCTSDMSE